MRLTKKEKAYAMACLISNGYFDYFDKIEWQPKRHKFAYYYDIDYRKDFTLKELAHEFDLLDKEVQQEAVESMRNNIGYYVEIAPNFENESDINSPMFKTIKEAKEWFGFITFQDKTKYSCAICFSNYLINTWGKVESL